MSVTPSEINETLVRCGSAELQQRARLESLLLRPEIDMKTLEECSPELSQAIESIQEDMREEVVESVEIATKYQRYIEKEQEVAERVVKFENVLLPPDIDYHSIHAISYEAREKLSALRPKTLGQASRISGVSPADVSVLLAYSLPS